MPDSHSPLLRLVFSALLVAPILSQAASAQESDAPGATLKINVRTVLVDVVVTDKNNKPIPGLGKDDFQVIEDGKPQQVTFFEKHFESDAAADASARASLPPGTFTNVPRSLPTTR